MSDKKKYTYFITGGGTGGHIYPAVAVAEILLSDNETKNIYYVGNPDNLEYEIVKKKNIKFLKINVKGMPRRAGLAFIKWGFLLVLAWLKCCYYIVKYKPDAVFATGGYVSAPALMACKTLRKPYMLHDCDAKPGLVTRTLSQGAKIVSLAFDCAKNYISNKNCIINGNPIRKEFQIVSRTEARNILGLENKITICITGGSQGAVSINNAAVELLKDLSSKNIQVIFQTGKKNFNRVIEHLQTIYPEYKNDKNIIIKPYFDDMAAVLIASDIAVSRAGSLSLSEISAAGLAAVLIPYPFAAADHQKKNAVFMLKNDAALYIEDKETDKNKLYELLFLLINDNEKLQKIQRNALSLAKYNAAEKIAEQLKTII